MVCIGTMMAFAALNVLMLPDVSQADNLNLPRASTNKLSFAYVFHATSSAHLRAVAVNVKRLQKWTPANLEIDYVVIVPHSLTVPTHYQLTPHVHETAINGPRGYYAHSMEKLITFNLTAYNRIVYMDADALVLKPLHSLFTLPNVSLAASLAYWENENCFTAAFMVITPNRMLYKQLIARVDTVANRGQTEMDLLNQFFQHHLGGHSKIFPNVLILPGSMLVLSNHFYTNVQGYITFEKFGATNILPDTTAMANSAWIVHFSGDVKPWQKSREAWLQKSANAISPHYGTFIMDFLREYDAIQNTAPAADITVCVPAMARDVPLIPALLQSIAAQTQMPAEVVIYLTGVDIVSKWSIKGHNTPVRIFTEPTLKLSGYSRNACIKRARASFVMFVDGDDQLHPERVQRVQSFIRKGYTLILNGHSDFVPDPTLSDIVVPHSILIKTAVQTAYRMPLLATSPVGITHGHPTILRTIALKHSYKETFHGGEDAEFLQRILKLGAVNAVFLHAKLSVTFPRSTLVRNCAC